MNNRYYVMRHGESTANKKGLIVSKPDDALGGYGLTARGAEQVMDAAASTRLGIETIIISSDYLRARETSEITHSILDVIKPIEYNTLLRERDFGDFNLASDEHYQDVWQHDTANPDLEHNGVETVSQVLNRGINLIAELELRYALETILLVGHGDVLQILLAYFNDVEPRFHRSFMTIKNAEIRLLPENLSTTQLSA